MKTLSSLCVLFLPATAFAAVSADYSENFNALEDGNTTPVQWTEPAGTGLSTIIDRGAGNKVYNVGIAASTTTASSVGLVQVTNVANPVSITTSVQFSYNSITSLTNTFATNGLLLYSDSSAGSYYRVIYNPGMNNNGSIEIVEAGGTTTGMTATSGGTNITGGVRSTATIPVSSASLNALYTLTATTSYTGTTLNFAVTLSVGASTISMSASDTSAKTGNYFGLRTATFANSTPNATGLDVDYDNFSLNIVPEPATASLCVLGALGLLRRNRRPN
jgi:hypothetical protein